MGELSKKRVVLFDRLRGNGKAGRRATERKAADPLRQAGEGLRSLVRKRPIAAVLFAAAGGALFGGLLGRLLRR